MQAGEIREDCLEWGRWALDFRRMRVAVKGMAGGDDDLLPSILYSVFTDQEGLSI